MKNARKNRAAVALGKRRAASMSLEQWQEHGAKYGPAGGRARAKALTSAQRRAIASKAAKARWEKANA